MTTIIALIIYTIILTCIAVALSMWLKSKVNKTKQEFKSVVDSEYIFNYTIDIGNRVLQIEKLNKSNRLLSGEYEFVKQYFSDVITINNVIKNTSSDFIEKITVEHNRSKELESYFVENYDKFNPKTKDLIKRKVNLALMILLHKNNFFFSKEMQEKDIIGDINLATKQQKERESADVKQIEEVIKKQGYSNINQPDFYYSTELSYA